MSIATIIAALQARHIDINGVTSAPTSPPFLVTAAECPAVLVDPLAAETRWNAHGGDLATTRRRYLVRVLALPAGLGEGVAQGREAAATLLDAILDDYRTTPDITTTAEIAISEPGGVRDSGVLPASGVQEGGIAHGGDLFIGCTIELVIDERYD